MNSDAFFRFVSPDHLYLGAAVFGVITAITVAIIYIFLYLKKKRFRVKRNITEQLNDWISEELTKDQQGAVSELPDLSHHFKKKYIRQFVTDTLINFKKNVAGDVSDSAVRLYENSGLKKDSEAKMKSLRWYLKAKGIYELYIMQQRASLSDILDYTNSSNEYVRTEAQTAIVGLDGFKGLIFLHSLSYPLHEWQQLKLLEQLDTFNSEEIHHLPLWLKSGNEYVVHFALKLAEVYQQFRTHDNVVECLTNENPKIRHQAIKTLGSIAEEHTVQLLQLQYSKESVANQIEILRQIAGNGTDADIAFLKSILEDGDDALKLEAGRALVAIHTKHLNILDDLASNNQIIHSIAKQINYERTT